jgi:hypothetical protein
MIGIARQHSPIKRDELWSVREADHGKSGDHTQRRFPNSRSHWSFCVKNLRQP